MRKLVLSVAFGLLSGLTSLAASPAQAGQTPAADKSEAGLPAYKRTVLGLYVTAKQAYAKWKADPNSVKIIDVRTPGEYVFVGHPAMAWNIPLKFLAHAWDKGAGRMVMRTNDQFVAQVRRIARPADTLLLTCRSGGRSAAAANLLAEAGFRKVYSITDGFEGDALDAPDSPRHGQRVKIGWKNSRLPWTYKLDPQRMYVAPK